MGCLCGCGADNQHCYLPNRSPSPNTLFENIYAPTFAESLESSLRRVITKSEPSKRVWWRKTYGGDAQDKSSPQFEKRYPLQGGRSHSPALSSDSERLQELNEMDYDSSIMTRKLSNSSQQYCSGLYSPPLDSCPKERPREDPSQISIRKAQASRFRALRDTFRRRAGFDVPTPPNVQNTSLETQIKRPYLEFPPKLFDYPPPSMQPGPVPESAKEFEQPSNNQACDPPKLQYQHYYDVPVQPAHLLAFQPSPPEHQQKYSTERNRTEFPKPQSPTSQASISQGPRKEEMQGSHMRKIEDEQCQPKSDHMACACGFDTHDHLHNHPNRPPSPNTLLEGSWTPESVDMLVARFEAVPSRYEPSKRVHWRQTYGGEAQDTIPRQHKWGEPTKFSDETRGQGIPISRLPTPHLNETEAEVKQDPLCDSKDSISLRLGGSVIRSLSKPPRIKASEGREAQKRPSPNNEEDLRIPLPPAKRVMHNSSSGLQENFTGTSLHSVFDLDQPFSDFSVKLNHSKPFQPDQGELGSRSAPIYVQRDQPKTPSPVKHSHILCSTSQASQKLNWTRDDIRRSVRRKAKESDPTDRLKEQAAISRAPLPNACLCGCGGDAMHCLLPNRPPSPNTFYENFWAPNFTPMLSARLEGVRNKLEPSKRIWWREEFGGCAPDREPSDSEIRGVSYDDLGDVLRTSPPAFSDDTYTFGSMNEDRNQTPGKRQHSTSPHKTPTARPKLRSPKSPTHYVPDRLSPLNIPDFSKRRPVRHKRKELTAEEDEQLLQSALRKLEASRLRLRRHGIPLERGIFAGEKSQSSLPSHHIKEVPSSIQAEKLTDAAEDILQMDHPVYGKIEAMKLRSLRHGTAIYQHEDSAAEGSPSISHGDHVEEGLSDTRVMVDHVEDMLSDTQVTADNPPTEKRQQWRQYLSQKIEAMKLRRNRRQGATIYRNDDTAIKNSPSTSHGNHEEEVPSHTQVRENETLTEGRQPRTHSLYQKIGAMKMRRNCRQGTTIYQNDDAAAESSPSTSNGNHDEAPSDTEVKRNETPTEEYRRWTQSLYQKIEAMKLRRNRRQGTTIYRNDDAGAESSPSISHSIPVDMENEASAVEHQQWRQSLYQKLEVMKLKRHGRQGICIYRREDTDVKCSTSTSYGNHDDMDNETPIEEHQLWRQSLYQRIESMKLRRNGRYGTSIYRHEDTAVESSTPISKVDYFAEMSITKLPTSMV